MLLDTYIKNVQVRMDDNIFNAREMFKVSKPSYGIGYIVNHCMCSVIVFGIYTAHALWGGMIIKLPFWWQPLHGGGNGEYSSSTPKIT